MISLDLALRLRAAGVEWNQAAGDRFMVPDKGMDSDVFLISEMVVKVLLSERFVRLEAMPGGYVAVVTQHGVEQRHIDVDADRAYARALLALSG